MRTRHLTAGTVFMALLVAFGTLGVVYGLWSKVIVIRGTVITGDLDYEVGRAYTDDDDSVDDAVNDADDDGDCKDLGINPITGGPIDPAPPPFPNKDPATSAGFTSCDPKDTGADRIVVLVPPTVGLPPDYCDIFPEDCTEVIRDNPDKDRYLKDVARCDAATDPNDPSRQRAFLQITNGYPSYHCTAWFDIVVSGTIPIHIQGFGLKPDLAGAVFAGIVRCEAVNATHPPTPFDLDGDGRPDVEICLSGRFAQQQHPRDRFTFDLDIHVLQTAPQGKTLTFTGVLCASQFNEDPGFEDCVNNPQVEGPPGFP